MKIAVLSGKGGTGKTFVSVNLAACATKATYVDCDVEEPNGHLFFKPQVVQVEDVCSLIPVVQDDLCTGCRQCVDFCRFNALFYVNGGLRILPDICHSCGGCTWLCPEKALVEKSKRIGQVHVGKSNNVTMISGVLDVGQPSGVALIRKALTKAQSSDLVVIDCPPGSACTVMESIIEADYCLLVAEPTVFGLHNLQMVHELVQVFAKPHGVVINKYWSEDNLITMFCKQKGIEIVGKFIFDSQLGKLNSDGQIAARQLAGYQKSFVDLLEKIIKEVRSEATVNP